MLLTIIYNRDYGSPNAINTMQSIYRFLRQKKKTLSFSKCRTHFHVSQKAMYSLSIHQGHIPEKVCNRMDSEAIFPRKITVKHIQLKYIRQVAVTHN